MLRSADMHLSHHVLLCFMFEHIISIEHSSDKLNLYKGHEKVKLYIQLTNKTWRGGPYGSLRTGQSKL